MDVVVDTSVVIAVIANGPQRAQLVQLTLGTHLMAPLSVHWEVGNAFSAMLRRQRVTLPDVLTALEAYRQIPIRFVDVELEESLRLAADLKIYAYDAYLIRCAQRYNAQLISLDTGLITCAKRANVNVLEVIG
jgi:predicted nucleic acid-binding protein